MERIINIFLPIYFIVFVTALFLVRALTVKKRTGHNPVAVRGADSVQGYMGRLALAASFPCHLRRDSSNSLPYTLTSRPLARL